jgi:hypothetical protein
MGQEGGESTGTKSARDILQKVIRAHNRLSSKQNATLHQCSVARLMAQIKKRDYWFWQGANRSDTGWYREDWQHRQGRKYAFLCAR